MLSDAEDIAGYILSQYPEGGKVIEVGAGGERSVHEKLVNATGFEVHMVDRHPSEGQRFDDIAEPEPSLYQGARLIYSIRPPPELIPHLQRIARKVGADLLIRPLSTDSCYKPSSMKLVNYGRAVLWVERR